jgi:Ca2+-binding EF-hand superfamily protein
MKRKILVAPLFAAATCTWAAPASLDDAKVTAALKAADADNDGTLDAKESARLGVSKATFDKVNVDKDGHLDKAEFIAAITAAFNAADPDRDGSLTWAEAQKAGIKARANFDAADPDKDGTLNLPEYLAALVGQLK